MTKIVLDKLDKEYEDLKAKADKLAKVVQDVARDAYGYEYDYETVFHRYVYENLSDALEEYKR